MTEARSPQVLSEGQTIQWYRVEKVLGHGGFGVTYLATDSNLDHRVAIKEFLPIELVERQADKSLRPVSPRAEVLFRQGLDRFLSEARTLVKFRHPNIVRVMAVFEANSTAYLVMEYEQGERFKEALSRQGGAEETTLKHLLLDIIDGLEQVHQRGFIHRDIKPVNIIIRDNGSPVLLDFGASRVLNHETGTPHTSFVSAGFTPLEQYQEGDGMALGPWTDIYSLAATLYFAINGGKTPVSAVSRLASLVKGSADPLPAATDVGHGKYSSEFLEAIDWALKFTPAERPQTLAQWRQAIVRTNPVLDGRGRLARRERGDRLIQPRQRQAARRWLWMIPVGAVLVAVASWVYQGTAKQRELQQLISTADQAFAAEQYLENARPRYQQVLTADPANQHATDRIAAIDQRLQAAFRAFNTSGKFDQAEALLAALADVRPDLEASLQSELTRQREAVALQERLSEIEQAIDAKEYQRALDSLAALGQQGVATEKTAALEQRARTEASQQAAEQRTQELQRLQREEERIENQRLLAEANERQRQRRRDYQQYLNKARWALANNDIEQARTWFESASAMQISDVELNELESQLEAAESLQQMPLSDYEVSYALGRFNALRRAIEQKNIAAIEELVGADTGRMGLFRTLFDRYTQISARVVDVDPGINPKRVVATLRIEKMALPNGDVVYPAASYRDSEISIERQRYTWSPIRW